MTTQHTGFGYLSSGFMEDMYSVENFDNLYKLNHLGDENLADLEEILDDEELELMSMAV